MLKNALHHVWFLKNWLDFSRTDIQKNHCEGMLLNSGGQFRNRPNVYGKYHFLKFHIAYVIGPIGLRARSASISNFVLLLRGQEPEERAGKRLWQRIPSATFLCIRLFLHSLSVLWLSTRISTCPRVFSWTKEAPRLSPPSSPAQKFSWRGSVFNGIFLLF